MAKRSKPASRHADENAFLRAIKEKPRDLDARLIYADWLEERSDVRGELIRVEEEMRNLLAWADRYWELKPRRNGLRKEADQAWLQQLAYGTDYLPIFQNCPDGWPQDWRSRWRLVRELVERWHGVPTGDVGRIAPRVATVEAQVGYQLPPAVREWITFLDDVDKADSWDSIFRDCWSLCEVENHAAFSLMIQGESDYHWAVQKTNLATDDPPVDGYYLDYESDESAFVHDRLLANHTSTWALLFILTYVDIGSKRGGSGFGKQISAEEFQAIKEQLPNPSMIEKSWLFEGKNFIAVVDEDSGPGVSPYLNFSARQKLAAGELPAIFQKIQAGSSVSWGKQ